MISKKAAYIVGVSIIILVTLFNQYLIQRSLNEQRSDATVINLAGRQRMLSQKIVKESYQLLFDQGSIPQLKQDVLIWDRVHIGLQSGDTELGLPANKSDSLKILFEKISPYQKAISDALLDIEEVNDLSQNLAIISNNEGPFLELMDQIVNRLEEESRNKVEGIINLEYLLAGIAILIILIEIQFIFRPLYRKLEKENSDLQQALKDLSKSKGELFESIQRFNLSIKAINAGIWDWFIPTNKEWWSPKFYEMLGYKKKELEPSYYTFIDHLVHPEDKKRVEIAVQDHLNKKKPYKIEIRMKTKSGDYRWFESVGQAKWDEKDEPIRMVGSIIDVHDRKELEATNITNKKKLQIQAKEREQLISLLEETQEIAQIGSWEVDLETMTCYWSDIVYEIHEVPLGSTIKVEDGINFYRDDYKPVIEKAVNNSIENQESWDEECVIITKKGNEVRVRAVGYPVIEDDKVIRLRGIFMDIKKEN